MLDSRYIKIACMSLVAASLVACGGDDDDDDGNPNPPDPSLGFVIGGTVTGLSVGKAVVLQNNGSDDLRAQENGKFAFNKVVDRGAKYVVTVSKQPEGQTCKTVNGEGTASADVTNIQVQCVTSVTPNPDPGPGPVPADGLAKFAGNWVVRGTCNPGPNGQGTGQANRRYVVNGNTMVQYDGVRVYDNGNCSGEGAVVGEPLSWTNTLWTSFTYQGVPIYRFNTTALNGAKTQWVYWLPEANRLCWMADRPAKTNSEIGDLIMTSPAPTVSCPTRLN
ncbi:DUF4369 domain-containing protein [Diaphorobacter aerolatus]|uniref:Carboxypeptidase regulatory-like domain-containing protein n=1 Tax=Diaphorobacter aerolatus TaxID=1288495 RepID=A0A7H0GLY8_9BURK|nr:DUF4369 domain-containing protein [Diaphorobacter aerolatus]QNP49304.1 hypothetical protein H9K75_04360 [Diaphorobacter aerolatus]